MKRLIPAQCRNRHTSRPGFTLIELLVVIAIVGILVALLLPAVQQARESARRLQCSNNLKQTGLAMSNYHDVHKCFPPGNITANAALSNWAADHFTNWAISLLPYLDLKPLHDQYHHDIPNHAPANKLVREQLVPVYSCPTDSGPQQSLGIPSFGQARAQDVPYRRGSYRGVSGRAELPGIMIIYQGFWVDWGFQPFPRNWRGVFHIVGPTDLTACESFASIRDGTSNTLAVGEKHDAVDNDDWDTYWAHSVGSCTSDVHPFGGSLRNVPTYHDCLASVPGDRPCLHGWGAYHPGGLNWLICDGSVRFISKNIDMQLLCQMASVCDGEPTLLP